jgi:murein DD-endopeptidase MepM/ murein hydrolase activator NlpD
MTNRPSRAIAALGALALLALAALAPRLSAADKFDAAAALARGHELAAHIVNNQPGPLWPLFAPSMREALKDSASFAGVLASISGLTGKVDSLLEESATEEDGALVYRATCRFHKQQEPWTLSIAFDDRARIIGMFVRPAAANAQKAYDSPHLGYVVRTPLRLPFRGEWTVVWGGREIAQNYHARTRDQRFALDVLVTRDGKSHAGEGTALKDYYCYGEPILAPADGRVVWLQDSLADNRPGKTDAAHPAGNAVILDHGNDEYSLLAHMQPRTIRFKLGERVREGEVLGLCGNSGNTSEPHLHYHLQDGPRFGDADGLPPRFLDVVVDGAHRDTAEVIQKQKVRRAK